MNKFGQERYRSLALVQARQKLDKENKIVSRMENNQNSLLERLAPHTRSSASSSYSSDSYSSSLSSSEGGGRVRKMFAARNRMAGMDKSLPLNPIDDSINQHKQNGRRNGISLERGRKGVTTNGNKKEVHPKRSQSEVPHQQHLKKVRSKKMTPNVPKENNFQRKPYVFNVPPNSIKAKTPTRKNINPHKKSTERKFAPKAGLVQCRNCTRSFASDRIETHRDICKKTAKKRKPFDISKARVEGTDAANYSTQEKGGRKAKFIPKSDWRKKRQEFVSALRAAKEAQKFVAKGGNIKDLPPPPPLDTSDYIQCPHCHRK